MRIHYSCPLDKGNTVIRQQFKCAHRLKVKWFCKDKHVFVFTESTIRRRIGWVLMLELIWRLWRYSELGTVCVWVGLCLRRLINLYFVPVCLWCEGWSFWKTVPIILPECSQWYGASATRGMCVNWFHVFKKEKHSSRCNKQETAFITDVFGLSWGLISVQADDCLAEDFVGRRANSRANCRAHCRAQSAHAAACHDTVHILNTHLWCWGLMQHLIFYKWGRCHSYSWSG